MIVVRRLQHFLIMGVLLVTGVIVGSYFASTTVGADTAILTENSVMESNCETRTNVTITESVNDDKNEPEVTTQTTDASTTVGMSESSSSAASNEKQQSSVASVANSTETSASQNSTVNKRSNETANKTAPTESTAKKATDSSEKNEVTALKPVKIVQSNEGKVEIAPTETKTKAQNTNKKRVVSVIKYDSDVLPKTSETQTKITVILLGVSGLFVCGVIIGIYRKYI